MAAPRFAASDQQLVAPATWTDVLKVSRPELIPDEFRLDQSPFFNWRHVWANKPVNLTGMTKAGLYANKFIPDAVTDKDDGICVLPIDGQKDFMDNGRLNVNGGYRDTARAIMLILKGTIDGLLIKGKRYRIRKAVPTRDEHPQFCIHDPAWFQDHNGEIIPGKTCITLGKPDAPYKKQLGVDVFPRLEVQNPFWRQGDDPKRKDWTYHYCMSLVETGQPEMFAWDPHCKEADDGSSLVSALMEAILFSGAARFYNYSMLSKGRDWMTDQYGPFKACVETGSSALDIVAEILNQIADPKNRWIIVFGEAMDFCVKTAMLQLLELFGDPSSPSYNPDVLSRIIFVEGATSPIFADNPTLFTLYDQMKAKGVNIMRFEDLMN